MKEETISRNPRKERILYSSLLVGILLVLWVMMDFVLIKEETFLKSEEYTFLGRTELEVKTRVKLDIKRYQTAPKPEEQVLALVHLLECHYFQLLTRRTGMDRYFDFIKIVLYPSQRVQLKNKTGYTRQVGRYLKRKKNLNIRFIKYELSVPVFRDDVDGMTARVLVKRTMHSTSGSHTEIFLYHFRKHSDNRFYLYFSDDSNGNTRLKLLDQQKET